MTELVTATHAEPRPRCVAGVDSTKRGWIAVVLENGRVSEVRLLQGSDTTFSELGAATVVAIDMPIGFGPRAADTLARERVGGSSVFAIPEEEKFAEPFGPGRGISAQAHALGTRIRHVTEVAASDRRFREVHPEVCFWAMNGERRLVYRKKSAGGALERMALLERAGIEIATKLLDDAARAPLDDVLDAAACAWTAQRIAANEAESLPPGAVGGQSGVIWY